MESLLDFSKKNNNFVPKILGPGEYKLKIKSIKAESIENGYFQNKNAFKISFVFVQETDDANFEGILIDKNDPSKGTYEGPVAFATYGNYPIMDISGVTKKGKPFEKKSRIQILDLAVQLLRETGKLTSHGNTIDSNAPIEKIIENVSKIVTDDFVYVTLGGKEYKNGDYVNINTFIVPNDYISLKLSISATPENLVKLDKNSKSHWIPLTPVEPAVSTVEFLEGDNLPF